MGRTQSTMSFGGARRFQYMAALVGSDTAPLSGDCSKPVVRELIGGRSHILERLTQWANDGAIDYAEGHGLIGEFKRSRYTAAYVRVRCRKCPECLRRRARLWAARGIDETASAERTWFGTLTLTPEDAFRFRLLAERTINRRASKPYSELNDDERTIAMAKEVTADLTKWLKRIRKQSKASLRYLIVCEPHKTGTPHWHILLHEHEGRVTKRVLEEQWRLGLSHWRLVEGPKAAGYCAKYLSKSLLTRVRASARYGTVGPLLKTDRMLAAQAPITSRNNKKRDAKETPVERNATRKDDVDSVYFRLFGTCRVPARVASSELSTSDKERENRASGSNRSERPPGTAGGSERQCNTRTQTLGPKSHEQRGGQGRPQLRQEPRQSSGP